MRGKQGHVAYPERADNPIRGLIKLIEALQGEPLDSGSAAFPAVASRIHHGRCRQQDRQPHSRRGAGALQHPLQRLHTLESLKALLQQRAEKAAGDKIKFAFEFQPSNAGVFVTKPSPFTDMVVNAIAEVTGRKPKLSTTGGTSDARFICDYCPVVEFGLVGQTMHQVDERVPVDDLTALTAIYRQILERYFG